MKLLLVDDKKHSMDELHHVLSRSGYEIYTVQNGYDALKLLKRRPIDMVICDMSMPKVNGAQLLRVISKRHPTIIRASLSSYDDTSMAIKGGFFAHQAFLKPCDPDVINSELERIKNLIALFPNKAIQHALGKITSLPVEPKLFFKVKQALSDNHASIGDIAKLISKEPAICAKIIHLSNNALFRGQKEVKNITQAITRLGSDVVTNIIAMLEIYAMTDDAPELPLEKIQTQSLRVATLASSLVEDDMKDTTFLVGILHDIGEYVKIKVSPELMKNYLNAQATQNESSQLEKYIFQARSELLGGFLLHLWGFPLPIIENVIAHNDPEKLMQRDFSPGCAVYIANNMINEEEINPAFVAHFHLEGTITLLEKTYQM